MGLSIWQILIILAVVLLLFGAGRIPRVMGDVGKGIRNMKKGLTEDEEEAKKLDSKEAEIIPPASKKQKTKK